jgi:hypothetical protein
MQWYSSNIFEDHILDLTADDSPFDHCIDGFATHDTCTSQKSYLNTWTKLSTDLCTHGLTIHVAAADQDVSIPSHQGCVDFPEDKWHAAGSKNGDTVSD